MAGILSLSLGTGEVILILAISYYTSQVVSYYLPSQAKSIASATPCYFPLSCSQQRSC
jgi:uncharacterized membrane protein YhdT